MAVIKCTNCGAVLKPKDPIAPGKKVKCPKCLQAFVVQADEPPEPAMAPPPPSPVEDVEEPFGEGIGAPEPRKSKAKSDDLRFGEDDETPTRKGKGGGRRDDDDGDDDDGGRKKSKGGDTPKKSNTLLIVSIIVGVLLLCCCCGGSASVFMSDEFQKAFQEELKKQKK